MEVFSILFVLGLIGLILVGSILGIVANSKITRLEVQMQALMRQINELKSGDIIKPSSTPEPVQEPLMQVAKASQTKPLNPGRVKTAVPATLKSATPTKAKSVSVKPPKRRKPKRSFEEEIGAKWTVWVGGIALLLGAVFLLRYSIEAGFFTPQMRIAMATLLGASLLGGGEWLRRNDNRPIGKSGKSPVILENSYIPGILTGVGIFTLLATVFAAYDLYGFIGPLMAFALMGVISLGALFLGLLHGPWISALGLVASFATPLLIQTETPNVPALFGYLSIISLAAWALAKFRDWGWLDLATLAGGLFWLYMALPAAENFGNLTIWLGFMALSLVAGTYIASDSKPAKFNLGEIPLKHSAITALLWSLASSVLLLEALQISSAALQTETLIALAFTIGLISSAFYAPKLIGNIGAAALFSFGYFVSRTGNGGLIYWAILFASLIGISLFWLLYQKKDKDPSLPLPKLWAYVGAFTPTLIILAEIGHISLAVRLAMFLGLAVLFITASYLLRSVRDDQDTPHSAYPWGAAFAFWIAIIRSSHGLEESLGLISGIAIFALLYTRFKWSALRWISLAFAVISMIQILYVQIPQNGVISSTLIFNELWIYLFLPAILCFGASWVFQKQQTDLASEGLKGFGVIFAALFCVYQIRHAMNGGIITVGAITFDELALQVVTGLCFTLGGVILNIPEPKPSAKDGISRQILPLIFTAISYLTLAVFALGLCFAFAPLFNQSVVIKGGTIFNPLILAYALPAVLMALIIWIGRNKRPDHYIKLLGGLTALGAIFYITSQIRRFYSGPRISIFDNFPEGLETYTISASWLVLGIGLLFAGLKLQSRSLRLASAAMIFLTVLKAFLIDMSTLEGVLRAISFVILGLVLIVIGRVYQNVLFQPKTSPSSDL